MRGASPFAFVVAAFTPVTTASVVQGCSVVMDLKTGDYRAFPSDAGDGGVAIDAGSIDLAALPAAWGDAGLSLEQSCPSAADCKGDGVCCVIPANSCVLQAACSTFTCLAPLVQLCDTVEECMGTQGCLYYS